MAPRVGSTDDLAGEGRPRARARTARQRGGQAEEGGEQVAARQVGPGEGAACHKRRRISGVTSSAAACVSGPDARGSAGPGIRGFVRPTGWTKAVPVAKRPTSPAVLPE